MERRFYMRLRVLHIEDDADVGKVVARLLSRSYLDVYLQRAATLREGVDLLYQDRWDAVLLDLTLPDSVGSTTFNALYQVAPQLPIIVLTGETDIEVRAATIALGAQDCLDKVEITTNLLTRTLRFAVERQRTILELQEIIRELELSKKKLQELITQVDFSEKSSIKH
jgi:DNA-binding response OmpR family regulator